MNRKPNFFIIGAPKCGTTSLVRWLDEHPNIYISPNKEPRYYDKDLATSFRMSEKEYLKLFSFANDHHIAIGEATVWYLYSRNAIPLIEKDITNAKYIVLIRNPVEMAYSLHEQFFVDQIEPIADFDKAFELSPLRSLGKRTERWIREPRLLDYQSVCSLGSQLENLYLNTSRAQTLVLLLDDFKNNPRNEYLKVLDFLGVRDDGRGNFPVYNSAKRIRSKLFQRVVKLLLKGEVVTRAKLGLIPRNSKIIRKLNQLNKEPHPRTPLPESIYRQLEDFFDEEIKKMENLLGKNLSHWHHQ